MLGCPDIFTKPVCEELRAALAQNGLIDRKRVCLVSNEKLDRQLAASAGKLGSIAAIVRSESANLGGRLRMLVLTDYIKRDLMKLVGTDTEIGAMGAVPIFETIRRSCGEIHLTGEILLAGEMNLALLSVTLFLVPDSTVPEIVTVSRFDADKLYGEAYRQHRAQRVNCLRLE